MVPVCLDISVFHFTTDGSRLLLPFQPPIIDSSPFKENLHYFYKIFNNTTTHVLNTYMVFGNSTYGGLPT